MKISLMVKTHLFWILLFILLPFIACTNDDSVVEPVDFGIVTAKIAVFSDPHYFDPLLGANLNDSSDYLSYSKKMVAASDAILTSTIDEILKENVNIILVPGDLTKDGELQSHLKFADHLKQIENAGAKVYVVPGNHDVNNPNAMNFNGAVPVPTENITPSEFAEIYSDFGYGEALYQDPNSLSYVVQPLDELWIIGMDDCDYDNNLSNNYSVTRGRFKSKTYEWIKTRISEGVSKGKMVFGIVHHNLIEHFIGQKEFFSPYVIDNHATIQSEFASLGLKLVFTGHFHAQDVVKHQNNSNFLFEIETGSLVTWPSPFRIMELTSNKFFKIQSDRITNINYDTNGFTFQEYAKNILEDGMPDLIKTSLINDYSISETNADIVAPLMTEAILAHYAGDESASLETQNEIQQLFGSNDETVKKIAAGLNLIWLDLPPQDNDVIINLNDGSTK